MVTEFECHLLYLELLYCVQPFISYCDVCTVFCLFVAKCLMKSIVSLSPVTFVMN